jgi:hypothetical protein
MSQLSDEYRHRESETVSVKTSLLWRSIETSTSTCKGTVVQQSKRLTCKTGGESGSAINQDSCCRKEMAVHVSTDAGMRGSQGTASLRSTISGEEVWWCGVPFLTADKVNWCTSPETLTPLDTEMRFWHHTCCPQWTAAGKLFSTRTLGRTQLVLLLTL